MKKVITVIFLSLMVGLSARAGAHINQVYVKTENQKQQTEEGSDNSIKGESTVMGRLESTSSYYESYKSIKKTKSLEEITPEDLPIIEVDYDSIKKEIKIEFSKYKDKYGNQNASKIAEGYYKGSAIYVPLFLQTDERWGNIRIGNTDLADGGCGVVSLCMVSSALGNIQVPSNDIAKAFNKYYINGVGLSWDAMTRGASETFGLKAKNIGVPSKQTLLKELQTSIAVVSFKPGTFTNSGHFAVITLDKEKNTIQLLDPNDSNKKLFKFKDWAIDDILKEVKGVWVYSM